jgi:hypothetical protein
VTLPLLNAVYCPTFIDAERLRIRAHITNTTEPTRVKEVGSGVNTVFELPCIETNSSWKVWPKSGGPPKEMTAGNVRLLTCAPPRVVVWPRLSLIMQALKNAVAPPAIWQEPLLATPVPSVQYPMAASIVLFNFNDVSAS